MASGIGSVGLGLSDIELVDSTTAIVTHQGDDNLFSVNLLTGQSTLLTAMPLASSPNPSSLALRENTAFVVGYNNNNIYRVDLSTGESSIVTTVPGATGLWGIALGDGNTAYVVDGGWDTIYVGDLSTGVFSPLTTVAGGPQLSHIAYLDTATAYTEGGTDNNVYTINLLSGSSSLLTSTPIAAATPNEGLFGIYIRPKIMAGGLSGNNQKFASYLNDNAPPYVIRRFNFLTGESLNQALESAAPTRNAFATFASQNAFLSSAQIVSDHLYQRRIAFLPVESAEVAASSPPKRELLAGSKLMKKEKKEQSCLGREFFSAWASPFGAYSHEKQQDQTPAFSTNVGGIIAGSDYQFANANILGFGGAYVYTKVHQEQGAGKSSVNQGFLTFYATTYLSDWYADWGLWGGYYHTSNQRKVSFPGFNQTAKSTTHGWQLAPHAELGYKGLLFKNCFVKWFGIEPFLSLDWVANWEKGFRESGATILNMEQKGKFCSFLRGETGLRLSEILTVSQGKFAFHQKASYVYQKGFDTGTVEAFLVGSPGTFTVNTLTGAFNLGVAEAFILFIPNNKSVHLSLSYQGEFGSRYQSHQGMLQVNKVF